MKLESFCKCETHFAGCIPGEKFSRNVENTISQKGDFTMGKTIQELTADLLAAPSACKEIKEAAQNYLDAVGKEGEAEAAKAYVAELEADIMPIDGLIAFAESDMGVKVFGTDGAKNVLIHAKERKEAGEKYCDCPACAACEALLNKKDEILK